MATDYNPDTPTYSLSKKELVFDGQRYFSGGEDITGAKKGDATIGPQIHPAFHIRDSLEAIRDEDFFQQMASTINMPKHHGKKVIRSEYYPVLDDRNQNDQGIDATGARYDGGNLWGSSLDIGRITGSMPVVDETGGLVNRIGFTRVTRESNIINLGLVTQYTEDSVQFDTDPMLMSHKLKELMVAANRQNEYYLQIELLNSAGITMYAIDPLGANSKVDLVTVATVFSRYGVDAGSGATSTTALDTVNGVKAALTAVATLANSNTATTAFADTPTASQFTALRNGIYANSTLSSTDTADQATALAMAILLVQAKTEVAKNLVTQYPRQIASNLAVDRYLGNTAEKTFAGIPAVPINYTSTGSPIANGGLSIATSDTDSTVRDFSDINDLLPGNFDRKRVNSEVTYNDLMNLASVLNENLVPQDTTVITGTQMTDTRTIQNARMLYVGPKVEKLLRRMRDPFGDAAFVDTSKYGAASNANLMKGEIGSIDRFRIISVPKMVHWAGAGAEANGTVSFRSDIDVVDANGLPYNDVNRPASFYSTTTRDGEERFDVFPMLFVGKNSFSNIGFKTSQGKGKFNMIHKPPGLENATMGEPFGKNGFMSIQWWMGMLVNRPEHIAVINTIAPR